MFYNLKEDLLLHKLQKKYVCPKTNETVNDSESDDDEMIMEVTMKILIRKTQRQYE